MESINKTATPEIEFVVNRRKDLEAQLKKAYETWMAINGAIQECNITISALSKMQLEREAAKEVPESIPENVSNHNMEDAL
jgi:hypothetical protein